MRPKKQINPGAHRSGTAGGKGRFYTTGLPEPDDGKVANPPRQRPSPVISPSPQLAEKYVGRASVGPNVAADDPPDVVQAPTEWIDPLDQDDFDLSTVEIDLRQNLREDPPDTYFERYSSRVPGHQ